jgi:predicted permease
MIHIVNTIIPIFLIILLGWILKSREYLPANLTGPLNRIVYYLAIPAMIFREIAEASFQTHFHVFLIAGTLVPLIFVFLAGLGLGRLCAIQPPYLGTFLQSSFHGNLGYIGLAVAYYLLGKEGFTSASILAGFLMLLQNFLAVLSLQIFSQERGQKHPFWFFSMKIFGNPVILSVLFGILFSVLAIPIPEIIDRSLKILSSMSLPLALLLIGASLSFDLIKSHFKLAFGSGLLKLLLLPGLGFLIYRLFGLSYNEFIPGLILLASPTATITYVMASEMHGSTDLATAAVSLNTLLSSLTFIFWLSLQNV